MSDTTTDIIEECVICSPYTAALIHDYADKDAPICKTCEDSIIEDIEQDAREEQIRLENVILEYFKEVYSTNEIIDDNGSEYEPDSDELELLRDNDNDSDNESDNESDNYDDNDIDLYEHFGIYDSNAEPWQYESMLEAAMGSS